MRRQPLLRSAVQEPNGVALRCEADVDDLTVVIVALRHLFLSLHDVVVVHGDELSVVAFPQQQVHRGPVLREQVKLQRLTDMNPEIRATPRRNAEQITPIEDDDQRLTTGLQPEISAFARPLAAVDFLFSARITPGNPASQDSQHQHISFHGPLQGSFLLCSIWPHLNSVGSNEQFVNDDIGIFQEATLLTKAHFYGIVLRRIGDLISA